MDQKLTEVATEFVGVSQTKENPGRKFKVMKMNDSGDFVSGTFEWLEDDITEEVTEDCAEEEKV
jgi:hypothetical protein